jgi:outer membrane receptor protein involved in Fe transport
LLAATAWLAVAVGPVFADDPVLEEVVVTGSRIGRPDFSSASPIVSVDQTRFQQSSAITVEGVLDTLPQFVPSFGSTSNNPGNGGQSNLSLRGLPTTATLVLMDGRRMMPANGTGVVDVNIIPPSLIESVEVITGGASAVYGSDALAGVVNFRLRRDFDGVEFDALGAVTGHGDADESSFGLTAGTNFADGRGSLVGYAGYTQRDMVTYADRQFSRYALVYRPPESGPGTLGPGKRFVPFGSDTIEEGRANLGPTNRISRAAFDGLMLSYGYAAGTVPFQTGFSFNDDGSLFTAGTRDPATGFPAAGGVANFRGERDPNFFNDRAYTFNFAPYNALRLPLERTSFFGRGDYDLGDTTTVFAEALYADYSATQQLAATPVRGIRIPVTNPYVPADLAMLLRSRPNPAAPFSFFKRMSALGPREGENNYDVLQATLGAKGEIGGGWTYDAYVQYGNSDQVQEQNKNVRTSRFEELTSAADGGVALCGGFDPFGNKPISAKCAEFVTANGSNTTRVRQFVAEATASGSMVSLPAGDLRAVVGTMFKRDEYTYKADEISRLFLPDGRPEIQGFNASDDVDGYDYDTDLFVEASVPLLSGRRWAQSLDLVLGYRWSDYASIGGVGSYKAELLFRPIATALLRGSLQHAVRAPSVYELYLPQLGPEVNLDFIVGDPCNAGGPVRSGPDAAAVERLCVAQGVPAALLPTYSYENDVVPGVYGGNPDLEAETADTYTAGVVLEPRFDNPWLEHVQFSVDWYQIEIQDAIATVVAPDFTTRCYDRRFNPSFSATNEYCSYFSRDAVTGEIIDARELLRNIAGYKTSGVDLQVDWRAAVGPGEAGFNWLVGYVASFEELLAQGLAADDSVGTIGGVVGGAQPQWKWNLRASYAWSDFDVVAQWRYVDSMQDAVYKDYTVPSQNYLDLVLAYEVGAGVLNGLTFRVGVENLTNAEPPIFPTYVQANTDPSQYDVLGRRYFVRLNYRL